MEVSVGVGIVTRNRVDYINSLANTIRECSDINHTIIINDSVDDLDINNVNIINNKLNIGVGKSKNKAIQYLLDKNCNYIFILEDDVIIKDTAVFKKYIQASRTTGIQHFNFGPGTPFNRKQKTTFDLHNRDTLDNTSKPNPRLIVKYDDDVSIALYNHCAGVFSFFTSKILHQIGLHDERFFNAWEHVDHTLRIINSNGHPPFWWFADIFDSIVYLDVQHDSIKRSVTAEDKERWLDNINKGREIYKEKHGFYPNMCPITTQSELLNNLKAIKDIWTT